MDVFGENAKIQSRMTKTYMLITLLSNRMPYWRFMIHVISPMCMHAITMVDIPNPGSP